MIQVEKAQERNHFVRLQLLRSLGILGRFTNFLESQEVFL